MRAHSWLMLSALAALSTMAAPSLSAHGSQVHAGRALAATCANCHGTDGHSAGSVASLAGQSAQDIATKLSEFKQGSRHATIMHQIAKGFSDEQIKLIADYFAQQKK